MYYPVLARFLGMDPYVQMPDYTQAFNRYAYGFNNPLKYADPGGEFFWIIPNIGWSKNGGLSIGISVVVGFNGGLSAQAGIGYNFGGGGFYAYAGVTYMFNTAYASYSYSGGFSTGYTAGLSLYSGFPVSTNFTTVGANYNITHNSWSGNLSAWSVDKSGWSFSKNYDYLRGIYEEELFHSKDYLYARKNTPKGLWPYEYEEWRAHNYLYKSQGLYSKSGIDWIERISYWGIQAGVYDIYTPLFSSRWWHFIYKIPRRW
jgi:hypothetical protein